MPSIAVYGPSGRNLEPGATNPLPQLLQTPSGLALLELQGTIHVPPIASQDTTGWGEEHANVFSTSVGKLMFPGYSAESSVDDKSWMKRVYLYVGKHQRLTGEVKKLSKPIGVMRKRDKTEGEDVNELEIVEIVKFKIVFSQRPEPVGEE